MTRISFFSLLYCHLATVFQDMPLIGEMEDLLTPSTDICAASSKRARGLQSLQYSV
jgi:hypothetical protein